MHQFQLHPLAGDLTGTPFVFTNSSLWMLIVLVLLWLFMLGGMKRALVPGRWQVAVEGVTGFVTSMLDTSVGPEGRKFVPWIFTIFMFILFCNLMGLMPFALVGAQPFTVTSQFTITGVMAIISFSIVLITGFWRHGLHFFSLFVPHGTPFILKLLIVPIEFISFCARPLSLSMRLFANMLAGHTMLKVMASFVICLGTAGGLYTLLAAAPEALIVALTALEFLVAFLQAYVFAILSCIYLSEALHLHDNH